MNFFDPLWTSDGKPYAPEQFNMIIQERYQISKNTHTSYSDLGEITPTERAYLIKLVVDDLKMKEEIISQLQQ